MTDLFTSNENETAAAGRALGVSLVAGDVVLLVGPLGAGKTAFARGLAEGLGCNPDDVSSPTFTIVQEYSGPIKLQHIDLYRLKASEVDDLALEDLMEGSVLAVEWPDRWTRAPLEAITIHIEPRGGDSRQIVVDDRRATG